ncbi:MAG: GIY-YIG nuclease family protein [Acetobacteraceae bacterium]|nr:GIY-YIG nuclease family protein [Acetobacteraceae bacterium]
MKQPAIYIMASTRNGTLYVGVTSDLIQRVGQHRSGEIKGFTKKYECKRLVYFAFFDTMEAAISREKAIKGGSRGRKIKLIEAENPLWFDLWWKIIA